MSKPFFIDLNQAREVLAEIGIDLNERQMKRAAEKDAMGQRKLPFFVDPIDKKLKIEKHTLMRIYNNCQVEAERNWRGE
ncbi:MAG: hypothetical protein R3E82_11720 [Pseudomonadales bacterium]